MTPRRKVWTFRALALLWALLAIPGVLWWPGSVLFVILMSLYANCAASLASAEAADDREILGRLDRIEAHLGAKGAVVTEVNSELPFSLDWLTGAASKPKETLSVCDLGHLVVNGRTHWKPERVSKDMHAIWFRWVEHREAISEPADH